jgi:3-(methylthio)propanoyl-CoA dehydrogenase
LAPGAGEDFHRAKIATARFHAEQIPPKANALLAAVKSGASTALALEEDQF